MEISKHDIKAPDYTDKEEDKKYSCEDLKIALLEGQVAGQKSIIDKLIEIIEKTNPEKVNKLIYRARRYEIMYLKPFLKDSSIAENRIKEIEKG
jgi:hypothetical protein